MELEKHMSQELDAAKDAVRVLLRWVGEDPSRQGLLDTPARVVKALLEMTSGYAEDAKEILSKNFNLDDNDQLNGKVYDQMIVSKDIPYVSMCEHHMLPFTGFAHVAYIPSKDGIVVGLSKLARVVDAYAKRLQVQERLTEQIANVLDEVLDPLGVAVIITGKHSCQHYRGVKKDGVMVTSAVRGYFKTNETGARSELLELLKLS